MAITLDGTTGITTPGLTNTGTETLVNLTTTGNTTLGDASTDTILMNGAPSIGGAGLGMGMGFRNRIINGAMVIDQRNAGASVTALDAYAVDRFQYEGSAVSKFTLQQNAGSVTPPAGFTNYYGATSSSAYSVGASDFFLIAQRIEGFNVADLAWGTASAATVTLSFWVRSSLTGTFGGALRNSASNRSYPFSYTISSANTWEQKSVTIAGDTSGTWVTNNGLGIRLSFSLGTGTTYSGTAGAWAAGTLLQPTGATSVVGTNGATFYITGVQLEKGSTATSFDYRSYGTELALCQRYLPAWNTSVANAPFAIGQATSTASANIILPFQVQPRVPPTGITASAAGTFYLVNNSGGVAGTYASTTFSYASLNSIWITSNCGSGLGAGNATLLGTNAAPAQILASGCEL
jgi:hypothetical protein